MHFRKHILLGLLSMSLMVSVSGFAAPAKALSKAKLEGMIKGNTIKGSHVFKSYTFVMYFKADGTHVENRNGNKKPGKWHVSPQGKLCWSYNTKDKTWCRWIVDLGNGKYAKVKGKKKKVRKFKVVAGNPNKL